MSLKINTLFKNFMKEKVNLDPVRFEAAIRSRNSLEKHISNISKAESDFPNLFSENIYFGSFARKTKIRPIDDIDIMVLLNGKNGTYNASGNKTQGITVCINDKNSPLRNLCNDGTCEVNSIKIINKFKDKLSKHPQYEKSTIHRNQEAMTLKLKSYEWNFDIVPCFITEEDKFGKSYYLIPDGNSMWKKTDPRIDRNIVTEVNKTIDGNLLKMIRLVKYWNRNSNVKNIPSYLLENIVVNFYKNKKAEEFTCTKVEFCKILDYISVEIFECVEDPKNIQGNLNTLDNENKKRISDNTKKYFDLANKAIYLEENKRDKEAVETWKEIFGEDFPDYE